MAPSVIYMTDETIASRRAELLGRAHVGVDGLRARDAAFMLDPEEQAILRELEDLDYLQRVG